MAEEVGDVAIVEKDSDLSTETGLSDLRHDSVEEGFALYEEAKGGMIVAANNLLLNHFVVR